MTIVSKLESRLALLDKEEEALAHQAPKLDALSPGACDRIARIAFRIAQVEAERARAVVPAEAFEPWTALPNNVRARQRATVMRIVQALVLTGWIAPPDA